LLLQKLSTAFTVIFTTLVAAMFHYAFSDSSHLAHYWNYTLYNKARLVSHKITVIWNKITL